MLLSVAVLALLASVQGRAVNISNTWVLPEEGFPVFYRYFRDRISWYEADAVCQFHHANLVTVDTTAQYDAVRAYLKELDISSAVWVGLIRSNPDGDFTWTDYRGLSGDGYWSSAPDARSAPLCAAADPAADYRWEARACGGPTVASFICELPVPQWALGNEGCMIRALPALTILYLPESAAVQLTADCGMAGVKKVQCTGNVKREDLLKELSCADEEEMSSTPSLISTSFNWPASTDSTYAEQDTTNEETTEETMSTELEIDINQAHDITATSSPHFVYPQSQYRTPTKIVDINKENSLLLTKNVNLGGGQDNNVQSNFIPRVADENNILTNDQLEKLEDERHMKHKLLHEEIARVGNVENIFTQPTDHFIPPLVMAKAKISDDMTVLSLAEKHAQQLAEKQFSKQNLNMPTSGHLSSDNYGISSKSFTENVDKPFKFKENKKETLKSNLPKKFINKKHYDAKNKISKITETKLTEKDKTTESPSTTESTKGMETTTKKIHFEITEKSNIGDDSSMDLTVILKDAPVTNEEQTRFLGDVVRMENIQNNTSVNHTEPDTYNIDITLNKQAEFITTPETTAENNVTNHVITVTSVASDDATVHNITVFTLTTKLPVFRDSFISNNFTTTPIPSAVPEELHNTGNATTQNHENITQTEAGIMESENTTDVAYYTSNISSNLMAENLTTAKSVYTSTETTTEIFTTTSAHNLSKTKDVEVKNVSTTTAWPVTITTELNSNTTLIITIASNETIEKMDGSNSTEYHELLINTTDHQHLGEEDLTDSDFQSPLLSGAVEPMHRPPRIRRPQQPNRNKFNPFRILG